MPLQAVNYSSREGSNKIRDVVETALKLPAARATWSHTFVSNAKSLACNWPPDFPSATARPSSRLGLQDKPMRAVLRDRFNEPWAP